jgi:hypothetical protein
MNRWLTTGVALLVAIGLCAPARAGDRVPFKATFHGFARFPYGATADPNVFEIFVALEGEGTHIGRFREDLTHYLNFATGEFTGFAIFTAANGDTFRTEFYGQVLGPTPDPNDDPAWVTFEVFHTIVEGTGRFADAFGAFVGVDGRYNLETGEDIGGYKGWISSPGASKK